MDDLERTFAVFVGLASVHLYCLQPGCTFSSVIALPGLRQADVDDSKEPMDKVRVAAAKHSIVHGGEFNG